VMNAPYNAESPGSSSEAPADAGGLDPSNMTTVGSSKDVADPNAPRKARGSLLTFIFASTAILAEPRLAD
jgi:hypothetical protein